MQLQQLLVVIDPVHPDQPALERARQLARHSGARVELLLCEYHSALGTASLFQPDAQARAQQDLLALRQQWLEGLAEPLRKEGLSVSLTVRWGKPLHRMILARIEELQPDLVLKTAHTHGLLQRLLLNNSSWQLIRHCPVPLWLARAGQPWQGQRLAVALDPTHSADKPASLDQQLLAQGHALAVELGMEDHYLHSYAPLPRTLVFDAELVADYEYYVERTGQRHREVFEQLFAAQTDIPRNHRHLLQGFAEETLPRFVTDNGIDLLIMGAIARGHLDSALIGHTAERVLENIACDLLVIKSAQRPAA
ncbi:universal stress protein [Pseudomonas sp. NW5]|uniref:universal stress protein n=1 Tax=Pseudomonas sp. NW5 TaxID=2934934 RepID=UPI00201FC29E|nr:universal stress protein [Pseudomonas sp. NW5]MCL7462342.1 universal stress protein [Pseudomonas sp. NW5]